MVRKGRVVWKGKDRGKKENLTLSFFQEKKKEDKRGVLGAEERKTQSYLEKPPVRSKSFH